MSRVAVFLFVVALCAGDCLAQEPAFVEHTARYYVVFLRPAASRKTLAKDESERIQSAHMANIHKMAQDGILLSAGPFADTPTTISGIFVFAAGSKVESLESARQIAAGDPTVIEHRNTADVHVWIGPQGIGDEYFRLHKLDPKTPENMQVHPLCIFLQGPTWEEQAGRRDSLLRDHAGYIDHLRQQRKLGAAGAIEAPDDLLYLAMFNPIPVEEAQTSMEEDPAVKAGLLRVEYHRWWSSDHVLPW